MTKPSYSWYKDLSLKEKSQWYGQIAVAYDKTRPRYPSQLITRAIEIAQLSPDAKILEIGSGPGTATTSFANLGLTMVCLEPNREAYQIACRNCEGYPTVTMTNTSFEKWKVATEQFEAVLAATSFHWVSSDLSYCKAAEALKTQGSLILLWNTPPQPSYELYYKLLDPVYQTYASELKAYEEIATHQQNLINLGQSVINSGYFHNLLSEELICEVTYSIDDYVGLLSTLSPYIAMDRAQRNCLLKNLSATLKNNHGNRINLAYLSVLQIAGKI